MNNLFIVYETYTNGYKAEILDIISLLAILCAILVILTILANPKLFFKIIVLYVKINAYFSSRAVTIFENMHALIPTVFLCIDPRFPLESGLGILRDTVDNINGQFVCMQTYPTSPFDKLRALQFSRDLLTTILKDNLLCANSSLNIDVFRNFSWFDEYNIRYYEVKQFYESIEFAQAKELNTKLKEEIIQIHKAGFYNENSYTKGDSPTLKLLKTQFADPWKSNEYAWRGTYSKRTPELE